MPDPKGTRPVTIGQRDSGNFRYRVMARRYIDDKQPGIGVYWGESFKHRRYEWTRIELTREEIAKLAKLFPVDGAAGASIMCSVCNPGNNPRCPYCHGAR